MVDVNKDQALFTVVARPDVLRTSSVRIQLDAPASVPRLPQLHKNPYLLHALCNPPFNKPLHPPEPSALPPSSPSSGEWKGDHSNHIYVTLEPLSVRSAVVQLPLVC